MVHGDAEIIDLAGLVVAAAVRELKEDAVVTTIAVPAVLLAQVEQFALRYREADIDRILAHDRRQRPGRRRDEVADRHIGPADPAGDRRLDIGVAELQLRLLQVGLRAQQNSLCFAAARNRFIEPGLRRGALLHQFGLALHLDFGELQSRLRLFHCRLGLVERRLVEALLDHEQELPFLDVGSLIEQSLFQKSLDPRAQIDLVDGFDPAGERCRRAILFGHDTSDRYGGRRRWRRGGRLRVSAGCNRKRDHAQRRDRANPHRIGPHSMLPLPSRPARINRVTATMLALNADYNAPDVESPMTSAVRRLMSRRCRRPNRAPPDGRGRAAKPDTIRIASRSAATPFVRIRALHCRRRPDKAHPARLRRTRPI